MAVGPYEVYKIAQQKILNGTIDLVNDTLGALLLVDGHTVDLDNHDFVDDVAANEPLDEDYSRIAAAGAALNLIAGETVFDLNDFSFGVSVTISARYLVIYRNVGPDNDATSEVLFIADLTGGGNVGSTEGNFGILNTNAVHKWVPNQ